MTNEHKIGESTYRIGRLSARLQLHIVRRIAPVFADSAPLVVTVLQRVKAGEKISIDSMIDQFGTAANALHKMSDEDVDYVIDKALAVVQRRAPGGAIWTNMLAPNGMPMFQDLSWAETIQLVWLVIQANVLNFFTVSPSTSSVGA